MITPSEPSSADINTDSRRAIVWDVMIGWFVGQILAGMVAVQVAAVFGWNQRTPAGIGGPLGRALAEAASGQALSGPPVPFTATLLFQIPFWLALVGLPFLFAQRLGRNIVNDFGLRMRKVDAPIGLVCGIVCQFLLVPLIYLPMRSFIDTEAIDDEAVRLTLTALSSPGGALMLVLLVVVGAPIVEEIVYRGGVQRALASRLPAWLAIVGATVIFAAIHIQLVQFPALAAIGIVAGVLAHRADRIGPAIWAHVGFNGTAAVALLRPGWLPELPGF